MSNNPKNKRKSFEIAPPSLSSAENEAFAKVLDSMLGRLGDQLTDAPVNQLTDPVVNQLTDPPVNQITSQPIDRPTGQPANQLTDLPVNQSSSPPDDRRNWSTNPANQLAAPVNQSASQPVIQQEQMFRTRIERRLKGIRLPTQKLERYEVWCFVNKVDFQEMAEQAFDAWLASHPVNHMMINDHDESDDEISSIIRSYEQWTGNKASTKDRDAIREVRDLPLTIIQCGILISVLRAPAKINSFRYCIGAIREAASSGLGAADEYLRYLKKVAERRNQAS